MSDKPIDEKRFTEDEVREILKRAVRKGPSRDLVRSEGLSLAELKAIGEEIGIDPARLEDAARAVTVNHGNRPNKLLGGPTVLDFERTVEGDFDPEDTAEILTLVRRSMGHKGEVDVIHGSLEWSARTEIVDRHITLSSKDGDTTIRGSANLTNAAVMSYLLPGAPGLIAAIVGLATFFKDGSAIGLIVALAAVPLFYMLSRTIFGRMSSAEATRLQQVVDELANLTEESED